MTDSKQFPTTTMAQRAANPPGPKTVTALLEKVDWPNDYTHTPEGAGEVDNQYFAVDFSYEFSDHFPRAVNRLDFSFDAPGGRHGRGGNSWRKIDAVPVDHSQPHILTFEDIGSDEELSDLYRWAGDFFLISDKLRLLIEEIDPGSIDCVEATSNDRELGAPYWACLPRRNLEAVDATKSHVWVEHKNYGEPGGEPYFVQSVHINQGAVFDPEVTKGAHHFWDIDLRKWFWSRELIARAHAAGIQGLEFKQAGIARGSLVSSSTMRGIYAEFPEALGREG